MNDSTAHLYEGSDQNGFESEFDEEADSALEIEARLNGSNGKAYAPFEVRTKWTTLSLAEEPPTTPPQSVFSPDGFRAPLKPTAWVKRRTQKQIREDMPPTPRGCEWRRSEEGWNLWRYWSEPAEDGQGKIKKTRYTGHLSHDAWQIMKEYDHEAFLSIVGQRLRRHGRG